MITACWTLGAFRWTLFTKYCLLKKSIQKGARRHGSLQADNLRREYLCCLQVFNYFCLYSTTCYTCSIVDYNFPSNQNKKFNLVNWTLPFALHPSQWEYNCLLCTDAAAAAWYRGCWARVWRVCSGHTAHHQGQVPNACESSAVAMFYSQTSLLNSLVIHVFFVCKLLF